MSTEPNTALRDLSAVDRFAARVVMKLRANDHKGPWDKCTPSWLLGCLRDEVRELVSEIQAPTLEPERVVSECCDVAAFAMMIADVVGGLPRADLHVGELPLRPTPVDLTIAYARAAEQNASLRADCARWEARVKLLESRIARGVGELYPTGPHEPEVGDRKESAPGTQLPAPTDTPPSEPLAADPQPGADVVPVYARPAEVEET